MMAGPGGRPTTYTIELGDRICDLVSTDTACLDEICEKHADLPHPDSIYTWRHRHPAFSVKYLQAMHSRSHLYAEETLKIAREKSTYIDAEGNSKIDPGYVAWQKMNVNLRQWHASKLAPKVYGDKQIIEQTTSENEQLKEELRVLRAELGEKSKAEY